MFNTSESQTWSWWSQAGSNRRPPACKAGALPAELWPQYRHGIFLDFLTMTREINATISPEGHSLLVGLGRFELPTSPLSGVRSNQLSYRPKDHQSKKYRSYYSVQ